MRTGVDLTVFEENIGAAWERGIHRLKDANNNTRQGDIAAAIKQSPDSMSKLKTGIQRTTTTDIYLAVERMGLVEPLEELARQCGYALVPLDATKGADAHQVTRSFLSAMSEAHEAIAEHTKAMADGVIDDAERARLIQEWSELGTKCNRLVKELGSI